MRIQLGFIHAHLINELIRASVLADILQDGGDIIHIRLQSGEKVAIHLVERDIDVGLIKEILAQNAGWGLSTLFMLDCPMLMPDHGTSYPPYDWMEALLTLYNEKIYAYEYVASHAHIFPVHFGRQAGTYYRHIHYGDDVNVTTLSCEVLLPNGPHLHGECRIAGFERLPRGAKTDQAQSVSYAAPHSLQAHFDLLGVERSADWETIRKAYRQLAREFHPDLNDSPEATLRMQMINAAYERLKDYFGTND